MKLKPIGGRILIKPSELKTKTEGGILLIEGLQEKSREGVIVDMGQGARDEKGNLIPFNVTIGEKVLYQGGTNIKVLGEAYKLLFEDEILAVIE